MKSGILFTIATILAICLVSFLYERFTPCRSDNVKEIYLSEQIINRRCTFENLISEVIVTGEIDTTEWHGRYKLQDYDWLWEPEIPEGDQILSFRKALRERLGTKTNSRELTKRQHDIFAAMPNDWSNEAVNSALLLEGRAGIIKEMSCLEIMLWEWQDARFPMLGHPTEFSAFVLRDPEQIRVYISSADLVGGRVNQKIMELMQDDIQAGFSLITHIHNHPFLFDREVGDRMWTTEATIDDIAGGLAPSNSDVGFYRSLRDSHGLKEAWITNGLQSSRFHASEFDTLRAR